MTIFQWRLKVKYFWDKNKWETLKEGVTEEADLSMGILSAKFSGIFRWIENVNVFIGDNKENILPLDVVDYEFEFKEVELNWDNENEK